MLHPIGGLLVAVILAIGGVPSGHAPADRGKLSGLDRTLPVQGERREERVGQTGRCQRKRADRAVTLSEEVRRPGVKLGAEARPLGSADRARPTTRGRPGEPEPTNPSSLNYIKGEEGPGAARLRPIAGPWGATWGNGGDWPGPSKKGY
ncbi:hypothetical protein NDU88_004987 [Pleurodeles waltl]|uniref:Uncharacterized protein n=1 Tax=Pleurodeles waltl TaxID=8319 RepID=A0AAV7M9R1_PLEWA|nr:hypothetical protein NDU88_004987 [Pleurodeles waltl]